MSDKYALVVLCLLPFYLNAQVHTSTVEGYLEVYHPVDSTSIYIGIDAGKNTDATSERKNVILGNLAGAALTNGFFNSFFGESSGLDNNSGYWNSFFGYHSGGKNTSGFGNSYFGTETGYHNETGHSNSLFGRGCGFNSTGNMNSFFGHDAGFSNETGSSNSFFGVDAGLRNTIGDFNSFFGADAGANIVGSENVAIGARSGPVFGSGSVNHRLYIDNSETNNPLIYGEFDNNLLEINGTLSMGGLNYFSGGDDGVIMSDANLGTSDLFLVSNDAVIIELDNNGGEEGNFEIWDTQDRLMLKMLEGGQLEIWNSTPNEILHLDPLGDLSIAGKFSPGFLGIAGGTDVCLNANGELSTCSSALRYKSDVFSLVSGKEILLKLRPVRYRWKNSGQEDIGLIAEEVAQVEPLLTTLNEEGQVEGVKYDRLGVLLVNVIKEQHEEIEKQKNKNMELESEVRLIRNEIEQLKGTIRTISKADQ